MDNELSSLVIIFTEFYYWVTVVFMFLIHVGFCMYEVGASRYKNHTHTLMKNSLAGGFTLLSSTVRGSSDPWWTRPGPHPGAS
jgi:ammonia channel protein AmtB